jgi:ATP-dependent helicase/nuclease subunit A
MVTPLWARAVASPELYAEVPVSAAREGTILTGTIDMAFREGAGWVLVDYKTDAFAPEETERFVSYYAQQLKTYAHMWQDATSEPVQELYLYFAHLKLVVAV